MVAKFWSIVSSFASPFYPLGGPTPRIEKTEYFDRNHVVECREISGGKDKSSDIAATLPKELLLQVTSETQPNISLLGNADELQEVSGAQIHRRDSEI